VKSISYKKIARLIRLCHLCGDYNYYSLTIAIYSMRASRLVFLPGEEIFYLLQHMRAILEFCRNITSTKGSKGFEREAHNITDNYDDCSSYKHALLLH